MDRILHVCAFISFSFSAYGSHDGAVHCRPTIFIDPIELKLVEGILSSRLKPPETPIYLVTKMDGSIVKIAKPNSILSDQLSQLIESDQTEVLLEGYFEQRTSAEEYFRIKSIQRAEKSLESLLGHSIPARLKKESELAASQASQLSEIYSHNTPPPLILNSKQNEISFKPNRFEERLLRTLYQDRYSFYELAHQDKTGNGVRDFAVGEYFGKLFELDTDVDGDGIDNYFDSHPFDATKGGRDEDGDALPDTNFLDQNQNKIPDHVDFELLGRNPELVDIQNSIFKKYKILLAEKDLPFTVEMARAIEYAMVHVFGEHFAQVNKAPRSILRVIASEKEVLLLPDADSTTFAIMDFYNKSLVFYDKTLKSSGPIQVAVAIHEIAHAFQASQDVYERLYLKGNPLWQMTSFEKSMLPLGWTTEKGPEKLFAFENLHGYWDESSDSFYKFRGRELTELKNWLSEKQEAFSKVPKLGEHYLYDPEIAALHIVNDYALTSPFEFHSEAVTAVFWNAVQERLAQRLQTEGGLSPEVALKKSRQMMNTILDENPGYRSTRYEMAKGSDYSPLISKWLSLKNQTLDRFINAYLRDKIR